MLTMCKVVPPRGPLYVYCRLSLWFFACFFTALLPIFSIFIAMFFYLFIEQ